MECENENCCGQKKNKRRRKQNETRENPKSLTTATLLFPWLLQAIWGKIIMGHGPTKDFAHSHFICMAMDASDGNMLLLLLLLLLPLALNVGSNTLSLPWLLTVNCFSVCEDFKCDALTPSTHQQHQRDWAIANATWGPTHVSPPQLTAFWQVLLFTRVIHFMLPLQGAATPL